MIKYDKNIAIYIQIKDDILNQILSGVLLPGNKLPSSREYSKIYGVTTRIILRVIEILDNLKVITISQGVGCFVTTEIDVIKTLKQYQIDLLKLETISKFTKLGIDEGKITKLMEEI